MKIDIIQTAMVATSTEYEIPDEIVAKGYEAIMDYINEHFDEIPGGDIEPENTFNWELDYEETSNKVVEALKEVYHE